MEHVVDMPLRLRSIRAGLFVITGLACTLGGYVPSLGGSNDDVTVAESLSTLLQVARTVVSRHQDEINNPNVGDKGFTGAKVLAETVGAYKEKTGVDRASIDPSTRQGRLLRAQINTIVEVVDANQQTINKKGLGFKAFIPRDVRSACERGLQQACRSGSGREGDRPLRSKSAISRHAQTRGSRKS